MGGECNYLLRVNPATKHLEFVPDDDWMTPEMLAWDEEDIKVQWDCLLSRIMNMCQPVQKLMSVACGHLYGHPWLALLAGDPQLGTCTPHTYEEELERMQASPASVPAAEGCSWSVHHSMHSLPSGLELCHLVEF